jgi:lipoate-protein ligase B
MEFKIIELGLIDFQKAETVQEKNFLDIKNGLLQSVLIICQHYPVITLGRQADEKQILITKEELKKRGIQVCNTDRGGKVTYHGPGQITIYPIFNLRCFKKDIHYFMRCLENIAISLLLDFQVRAKTIPGLTGVWVNKDKIASLGIAVRNWITFHGISINIKKNDLSNFQLIKPCGMDITVTSIEKVLDKDIEIGFVKEKTVQKFKEVFH